MAAVRGLLAIALAACLGACTPLIAGYSLQAYQNATTLKADVGAMVAQSTDDYTAHANDVSALTLRLDEAYEFSKGEPYNALSARQWALLIDPNGHLYGGFVGLWRRDGRLSAAEAANVRTLLDRAFDQIICLEANKQSASKCPAPEALAGQAP